METFKKILEQLSQTEDYKGLLNELSPEDKNTFAPLIKRLSQKDELIENLSSELAKTKYDLDFYLAAIDALPNPIFIKNHQANFVFFNQKYKEVFGVINDEYIGKSVFDLSYLPMKDRIKYHDEDLKMIETGSVIHYEKPFSFTDGDEHDCFYWSRGFSANNSENRGLIGEIVDISTEKQLEKELSINVDKLKIANENIKRSSKIDPSTGLYNRRVLDEQIPYIVETSKRNKKPLCVLLADLDYFKSVNDMFGHMVGDEMLSNFASILKHFSRENDLCIRYGGEEFLIFLPNTPIAGAISVGNRICEAAKEYLILPNKKNLTVSIGISEYIPSESLDTCLSRADKALYMAKDLGRGRIFTL